MIMANPVRPTAVNSVNAFLSSGRGETDRASDDFLVINNCGRQVIGSNDMTTIRRQGRKDYQLLYLWKGCGYFAPPAPVSDPDRLLEDNQNMSGRVRISEGEVIIYKPREPQIYTYRAEDHSEAYWLHMTGSGVESLLAEVGFTGDFHYPVGQHPDLPIIFQKIIKEIQRRQEQYEMICQAGFLELLALMGRHRRQQEAAEAICNRDQLLAVVDSMHSRYYEEHGNSDYAAVCNLSVYRFIHLFRQLTGQSPYAYQTRIRLDRARDLLDSTTMSIAEVAAMVGYSNPLYFSRIFRKGTGLSPTEYKKRG